MAGFAWQAGEFGWLSGRLLALLDTLCHSFQGEAEGGGGGLVDNARLLLTPCGAEGHVNQQETKKGKGEGGKKINRKLVGFTL